LRLDGEHGNLWLMVGQRRFHADAELLATAWRSSCETDATDEWRLAPRVGTKPKTTAGYFVSCGTVNGYAKPKKIDRSPSPNPRAAHEKIAADLAYDLGLPVPPVKLHRWQGAPPHGDQPFVAISLVPFLNVYRWEEIENFPDICQQMKLSLSEVASAFVPFDTWLDNNDRVNNGNLLVSNDSVDPNRPLRVAYLDHSNSMMKVWAIRDFKEVVSRPIYPTEREDADIGAMGAILAKIEAMEDRRIREIVGQIHDDFIPAEQKTLIIDALIYRRPLVRAVLRKVYAALQ
jgi:hypothetical protein